MDKLDKEIYNYDKVTKLLLSFKFLPQMLGFDYIRSAILFYLERGEDLSGITTDLYPVLAKHYKTQVASVERNIRRAVETAHDLGGFLSLNDFFDNIVYTNNVNFSNNEIIAILVEIINLDNKKQIICEQSKNIVKPT